MDNQSLVSIQAQFFHRGAESCECMFLIDEPNLTIQKSDAAMAQGSEVLHGETSRSLVVHIHGMNRLRTAMVAEDDKRKFVRLEPVHHFVIRRTVEQPSIHTA